MSLQLKVGARVKVITGKLIHTEGLVKFYGETGFHPGQWVGVELYEPKGKNDGSVDGTRYFEAQPRHGLFLRAEHLTVLPPIESPRSPPPVSPSETSPQPAPTSPAPTSPATTSPATTSPVAPSGEKSPATELEERRPASEASSAPEPPAQDQAPKAAVKDKPWDEKALLEVIKELRLRNEAQEKEVKDLQGVLSETTKLVEEQEAMMETEREQYRTSLEEMRKVQGDSKAVDYELQMKLQSTTAELEEVKEAMAKLTQQMKEITEENKALQMSFTNSAEKERELSASKLQQAMDEIKKLTQQLADVKSKEATSKDNVALIKTLNTQTQSLQERLDEKTKQAQETGNELADLKKEVKNLKKELKEKNDELQETHTQAEIMQLDLEVAVQEKELLEEQLEALNHELASMDTTATTIAEAQEIEAMSEESLRTELKEHRRLMVLLHTSLEEKENHLKEAKAQVKELKSYEQKCKKLEESLAEVTEQLEAAESGADMVEDLINKNLVLEESVDTLKEELQTLRDFKEVSTELELHHQEQLAGVHADLEYAEKKLTEKDRILEMQQKTLMEREAIILGFRRKVETLEDEAQKMTLAMTSTDRKLQSKQEEERELQRQMNLVQARKGKFQKVDNRIHEYTSNVKGKQFRDWVMQLLPKSVVEQDMGPLCALMSVKDITFKMDLIIEVAQDRIDDFMRDSQAGNVTLTASQLNSEIIKAHQTEVIFNLGRFVITRYEALVQEGTGEGLLQCQAVKPVLEGIDGLLDGIIGNCRDDTLDQISLLRVAEQLLSKANQLWQGPMLSNIPRSQTRPVPWCSAGHLMATGIACVQGLSTDLKYIQSLLLTQTHVKEDGFSNKSQDKEDMQKTQEYLNALDQTLDSTTALGQQMRAVKKEIATFLAMETMPKGGKGWEGMPFELYTVQRDTIGTLLTIQTEVRRCARVVELRAQDAPADTSVAFKLYTKDVQGAIESVLHESKTRFRMPGQAPSPGLGARDFSLMPSLVSMTLFDNTETVHANRPSDTKSIKSHIVEISGTSQDLWEMVQQLGAEVLKEGMSKDDGPSTRPSAREQRASAVRQELGSIPDLRNQIVTLNNKIESFKQIAKESQIKAEEAQLEATKLEGYVNSSKAKDGEIKSLQLDLEIQRRKAAETLAKAEQTFHEAIAALESDNSILAEDKRTLQAKLAQNAPAGNRDIWGGLRSVELSHSQFLHDSQSSLPNDSFDMRREIVYLRTALHYAKIQLLSQSNVSSKLQALHPQPSTSMPKYQLQEIQTEANGYLNELHSLGKRATLKRRCTIVTIGEKNEGGGKLLSTWKQERGHLKEIEKKSAELRDKISRLACQTRGTFNRP